MRIDHRDACYQLFQDAPQPMWLFDAATLHVLEVNDAALKEYGMSRETFLDQPISALGGASFNTQGDCAVRLDYRRPDGIVVQLELNTRLLSATMPPIGLCNVANVAKGTPTEQRLRAVNEQVVLSGLREQAARDELERANSAKDEFLAVVSHELRTPLHSMMGWAQMLRQGKLSATDNAHGLEVIERNIKLLAQLVSDLLDVSRASSGTLGLDCTTLDLRAAISVAVESISLQVEKAGVHLEVELPDSAVTVEGDALRLQQVVLNLLGNALKFARDGTVRLNLQADDAAAHIRVSDTGQGFGQDFLAALFQPFSQEHGTNTRAYGGLGIGLMIVRHLVEAHGGQVRAESAGKGQGATFTVDLPLSGSKLKSSETITLPDEHLLTGLRTLIVEDHVDARELLHAVLVRYGAEVHDAQSGDEALALLAVERIDVVISDLAMPVMDGYEFLRLLRGTEGPARNVPVVALSAYGSSADLKRALAAGFNAFAAKPVDVRQFVAVVAQATGRGA